LIGCRPAPWGGLDAVLPLKLDQQLGGLRTERRFDLAGAALTVHKDQCRAQAHGHAAVSPTQQGAAFFSLAVKRVHARWARYLEWWASARTGACLRPR
jgi:hypothetical protein